MCVTSLPLEILAVDGLIADRTLPPSLLSLRRGRVKILVIGVSLPPSPLLSFSLSLSHQCQIVKEASKAVDMATACDLGY